MDPEFRKIVREVIRSREEREGISVTPGQASAINIAGTPLHAGGNTVPAQDDAFPSLISASTITRESIVKPPLIVERLLHREAKMIIAGGSKTFKSWTLIDLGLSVATGTKWWDLQCQPAVVVYINFELIPGFLNERIYHVAEAKGIKLPYWFFSWNLRNKCYDLTKLMPILKLEVQKIGGRVDLIIVDPIYKALGQLEENNARDMTFLMAAVELLSAETGAAIAFGAHFSKGAQAQKEAKDRISGSGVFGRDPDVILTMTRHQAEDSYVVETELRYLPRIRNFVVSWKYPLMFVDEGKDPRDLWVPTPPRQSKNDKEPLTDQEVLACLHHHGGVQDIVWREQVKAAHGHAGADYYAAKARLITAGLVYKSGLKYIPTKFELEADSED